MNEASIGSHNQAIKLVPRITSYPSLSHNQVFTAELAALFSEAPLTVITLWNG